METRKKFWGSCIGNQGVGPVVELGYKYNLHCLQTPFIDGENETNSFFLCFFDRAS